MENVTNPIYQNPFTRHHEYLKGYFKADRNAKLPEPRQPELVELHVPHQNDETTVCFQSLDMRSYGNTWNDAEIMSLDIANNRLSKQDVEYQRRSEIENAKLSANMSDEQKDMLKHIEDFVGKSRLIEESKGQKNGN